MPWLQEQNRTLLKRLPLPLATQQLHFLNGPHGCFLSHHSPGFANGSSEHQAQGSFQTDRHPTFAFTAASPPKAFQEWRCRFWFREEQIIPARCDAARAGIFKTTANLRHLARIPVEGRSNKFGCLRHFTSKRINTRSLLISLQLSLFRVFHGVLFPC